MRTLVELPEFSKQAAAIWSEAEYEEFTFWIAQNPEAGVVITGTGGGRKVRWQREGMGKSGGARVIHYHLVDRQQVLLVTVYAKSDEENLPAHKVNKLRKRK
jgi:hypothetical protein